MIRTFVALEIPKTELSKIIQLRDSAINQNDRIRWEPIEKLHITLKFLGDTEESKLPQIESELQKILSLSKKLFLSFKGFGVFKKDNDPKILFVDLNDCVNLNAIVSQIEDSFTKFGYISERRKFKPHITLLRFKGREDKNEILKLLEVAVPQNHFEADTIHLFKSELKPSGSVYTSLHKYFLKN